MNKYRNQYQERDYHHTLLMVLLSFIFILFLCWLYKSHIIYYIYVGLYSLYGLIPVSLFRNIVITKMNLLAFAANHAVSLSYTIPKEKHVVGKYFNQRIERTNLTLRSRLKRLTLRTIGFSKSEEMHDKVIGTSIERVYDT